jgi:hypothetical protein
MGKTHLSARWEEGRSVRRNRLKKPDGLFQHINKSFAVCQEDIGFQDISIGPVISPLLSLRKGGVILSFPGRSAIRVSNRKTEEK